jgi:hypothetical protein
MSSNTLRLKFLIVVVVQGFRKHILCVNHLLCVHYVPERVNIMIFKKNYTYSFNHTPLTYKILISNSLYFNSNKKEKFLTVSEIYLFLLLFTGYEFELEILQVNRVWLKEYVLFFKFFMIFTS